jgi:hypothetical protein
VAQSPRTTLNVDFLATAVYDAVGTNLDPKFAADVLMIG